MHEYLTPAVPGLILPGVCGQDQQRTQQWDADKEGLELER